MEERDAALLAGLLRGAGRRLAAQHRLARLRHPSALDGFLRQMAGPLTIERGLLRPWAESMIGAYRACGGRADRPMERGHLETALAAFAAGMSALEILDDLIDGDEPDGGRQAPNLALACGGESMALLARLAPARAVPLLALWDEAWARCAAAQAQDVALSTQPYLTREQALVVAEGSGPFTRWAMEAGALLAGAPASLRAPLTEFSQHLGTAEKLLHDVHDLWPGDRPSRDLHRPTCNLALVVARHEGILPETGNASIDRTNDDRFRLLLLESGALHTAWAYADHYRLRAADALDRFAHAGGDPAPLIPVLALSPELHAMRTGDIGNMERQIALTSTVP